MSHSDYTDFMKTLQKMYPPGSKMRAQLDRKAFQLPMEVNVDVRTAQATVADDKQAIFDLIIEEFGFDHFNKRINEAMKTCLSSIAQSANASGSLPGSRPGSSMAKHNHTVGHSSA